MARESKAQKDTIERVMHEAKHGELKTAGGRKVKSRKQAIAIALHEAGASKDESPQKNRRNLARTKAKERRGETYQDEAEGRGASRRKRSSSTGRKRRSAKRGSTSRRGSSGSRKRTTAKRSGGSRKRSSRG